MSRLAELAAKLAADKNRSDELEAAMANANEIADQVAASFRGIGAEGKAAQISSVKSQLGQARNTRWLAEGHLEDALSVLQAAMDGQAAGGTASGSTAVASTSNDPPSDSEDGHSFTTDLDGQPVKVTIVPPEPEHEPGPSGQQLVEKSQEDENLSGFRRVSRGAVRKIDDLQSFAKDHARGIQSVSALDDVPGSTEAITIQDCVPEPTSYVAPPPPPSMNIVDTIAHTFVFAVGAVEASSRIKRRRKDDRDSS
jgi:hypothetical protein